jgi:hypothetical protein
MLTFSSHEHALHEKLTISIATKDRPEVVESTLQKIHSFGLGECPLIICDDGSEPALNPPSLSPITSKCTTCDHFKVHHLGRVVF